MKRALALAILSMLTVEGSGLAQKKPKAAAAAPKAGGAGGYEKVKTYDFSGDTIDGDLVKPDGEFVDTRKFAEHASLIKIRDNFIKEIVKSAEDL